MIARTCVPLRFPGLSLVLVATGLVGASTPVPPDLFAGLVWRNIGPFRGGPISVVTGVIGQPGGFYAGLPPGGVWKATRAGETWYPVFDCGTAASSAARIEVAP